MQSSLWWHCHPPLKKVPKCCVWSSTSAAGLGFWGKFLKNNCLGEIWTEFLSISLFISKCLIPSLISWALSPLNIVTATFHTLLDPTSPTLTEITDFIYPVCAGFVNLVHRPGGGVLWDGENWLNLLAGSSFKLCTRVFPAVTSLSNPVYILSGLPMREELSFEKMKSLIWKLLCCRLRVPFSVRSWTIWSHW